MGYTVEQLNEFWNRGGRDKLASDEIDTLIMDAIGKAHEIALLRATIEAVEWIGMQDECAWCSGFGKHALKCRRQYALGLV